MPVDALILTARVITVVPASRATAFISTRKVAAACAAATVSSAAD
jgi:hypothetical protein